MPAPSQSPRDNHPADPSPADAMTDTMTDAERRAALAKLGALAAWTAPTLLTLMISPRASAFSYPPDPPGNG